MQQDPPDHVGFGEESQHLAAPLILSVVAAGLALLVFWVSPLSMANIRWK
jgi:hypothetical protein